MIKNIENLGKLQLVRLSTCGSVDDGKSTLIGRLLFECGAIFEDTYNSVKRASEKSGFENIDYSFLLDGLKAEREQKITIDVAYRYFSTNKRRFIISDVPGHEQYTRNMVTGISNANIALILIDASKGMLTQTKRHLLITSLLGVGHILTVVNKMDLVDYSREVFENIVMDMTSFTQKLKIPDLQFIPVSAINGDMLKSRGSRMNWYEGPVLLDYLEHVYIESDINFIDFRFPVQMVLKSADNNRIYSGTLTSGRISRNETVKVLPSGFKTEVKEIISGFNSADSAYANQSVSMVLKDELDISRGDMIVRENNQPTISNKFQALLFWFSEEDANTDKSYFIKHTTKLTRAKISKITYKFDVDEPKRVAADILKMNDTGKVIITSNEPLIFDNYYRSRENGSFILINPENYNTVAAGLILKEVEQESINSVSQDGMVIWLEGLSGSGKSTIAAELVKYFHSINKNAEWIDGDDFRSKFNFDLGFSYSDRIANIQRTAYVAEMLVRNRINVIASFITPYAEQREFLKSRFDKFIEIFVDSPIEVCRHRDVKGLYKKAEQENTITNFTGVGDRFDIPEEPAIHLKTNEKTVQECINQIIDYLKKEYSSFLDH